MNWINLSLIYDFTKGRQVTYTSLSMVHKINPPVQENSQNEMCLKWTKVDLPKALMRCAIYIESCSIYCSCSNHSIHICTPTLFQPQTDSTTCYTTGVWSSHTGLSVGPKINPLFMKSICTHSRIYLIIIYQMRYWRYFGLSFSEVGKTHCINMYCV